MCTAATYKTKDFYFGRTLDYDFSYGEEITVTPRNYPFHFTETGDMPSHYAMIGVAHVAEGYPLYYDAVNERGLAMAGLNFVGNAYYRKPGDAGDGENQSSVVQGRVIMGNGNQIKEKLDDVAQFELLPWILGQCASVQEARELLGRINITDTAFSDKFQPSQLHWMISDKKESITLESVREGIKIYDNPVGVLTNNPPFDKQLFALNNYRHLSTRSAADTFSPNLQLQEYSRGLGALGLPGDLSSQSRFVRVTFVKENSVSGDSESESVSQFFHILGAGDQQRGCCELEEGKYEITIYTSCCNADKGIYYYTTYKNHQITAVNMHRENLVGSELVRYPMVDEEQIREMN